MMRSKWRIFLTAFLVVFLGGMGVSGAAALWSQSGVIKAQITTGTWIDYSRPNYSMPLKLSVEGYSPPRGLFGTRRLIQASWTNSATGVDPTSVTYRIEVIETPGELKLQDGLPARSDATAVAFETTRPLIGWPDEFIDIRVTPYVNNIQGLPTSQRVWLDSRGRTWLTEIP